MVRPDETRTIRQQHAKLHEYRDAARVGDFDAIRRVNLGRTQVCHSGNERQHLLLLEIHLPVLNRGCDFDVRGIAGIDLELLVDRDIAQWSLTHQ
jgi:hypothetical protein